MLMELLYHHSELFLSEDSLIFVTPPVGPRPSATSSFSKANLDNLKVGKSITSASKTPAGSAIEDPAGTWTQARAVYAENSNSTYVRLNTNDLGFYANGGASFLSILGNTNTINIGKDSSTSTEFSGLITAPTIEATTGSFDYMLIQGDIIPSTSSVYDLGSNSKTFRTASIDRIESFNVVIDTSGSSPFLIKIEGESKIEVNSEGVIVLGNMNSIPTAVTGGLYYSSGNFFVGIN